VPIRLAARAAMAAAERGDLTEGRRHLNGMTRTDIGGLGIIEPLYWWAQGVVARAEGQLTTAVVALQRAVDRYSAMGAYALRGFALVDLAEVTVIVGDGVAAAGVAQLAEDNARRTGAPIHQTLHLLATAWALIGRGHQAAAARAALRAVDGFSGRGYVLLAARARVTYAEAIQRCDRGAAEEALREAANAFDACGAMVRHQQVCSRLKQLVSGGQCTARAELGPGSLTRCTAGWLHSLADRHPAVHRCAHRRNPPRSRLPQTRSDLQATAGAPRRGVRVHARSVVSTDPATRRTGLPDQVQYSGP
jgi:hypothetical protein